MDTIRTYRRHDSDACIELFDANMPKFFNAEERPDFVWFLTHHAAAWHYQVVERAGDVVGCAGYSGRGAPAARSMEEQAVQLTEAVAVFKIDRTSARNVRPSAVAAPKPNVIHAKAATSIKAPTRLAAASKPLAAAAAMDGANWQEF
ncbi:hypothetical protein ABQF04_11260 [Xanthomonas campestris pv. campestris]|uniref:hypothetical protein n=1 Tax=Xanthomonas campestris TaxID=339 RepID=UPI001E5CCAE3|nr:hypothetical protein [Xanthomonas campestris]MCC5067081.1 hypothetical protein [Xanthomonas campestris]MEB2230964.1 hypothetical protein [Xanthomonas campestris pv. campestris]